LVAAALTRKVIWGAMGFSQLEFRWKGVEREDAEKASQIRARDFDRSIFTINEIRQKLGEPPTKTAWGDMVKADIDIAIQAAKGVGVVDDPDLASNKTTAPKPAAPPNPPKVGPAKPAPGSAPPTRRSSVSASSDEPEEES
jgi:hypothetical protein